MDRRIEEIFAELQNRNFWVNEPELAALHTRAASHLEKAFVADKSENCRNYERDFELEMAETYLDYFDSAKTISKSDYLIPLDD